MCTRVHPFVKFFCTLSLQFLEPHGNETIKMRTIILQLTTAKQSLTLKSSFMSSLKFMLLPKIDTNWCSTCVCAASQLNHWCKPFGTNCACMLTGFQGTNPISMINRSGKPFMVQCRPLGKNNLPMQATWRQPQLWPRLFTMSANRKQVPHAKQWRTTVHRANNPLPIAKTKSLFLDQKPRKNHPRTMTPNRRMRANTMGSKLMIHAQCIPAWDTNGVSVVQMHTIKTAPTNTQRAMMTTRAMLPMLLMRPLS